MAMSDCIKCWETPCICGYEYSTMTTDKLMQIKSAIENEIKSRWNEDKIFEEMTLLVKGAEDKDDFGLIWDKFWELSRSFSLLQTLHWCDPDTSYKEDIMARYNVIKDYLEE